MDISRMRENALNRDRQIEYLKSKLKSVLTKPGVLSAKCGEWYYESEEDVFRKDITSELYLSIADRMMPKLFNNSEVVYENGIVRVRYIWYYDVNSYAIKLDVKASSEPEQYKYKNLQKELNVKYMSYKLAYLDKLYAYGLEQLKNPHDLKYYSALCTVDGYYSTRRYFVWTSGEDSSIKINQELSGLFCYSGNQILNDKFIMSFNFKKVESNKEEAIIRYKGMKIIVERHFTTDINWASLISVRFEATKHIDDFELSLISKECQLTKERKIRSTASQIIENIDSYQTEWYLSEDKSTASTIEYAGNHSYEVMQLLKHTLPTDIFTVEACKLNVNGVYDKAQAVKITMKMK